MINEIGRIPVTFELEKSQARELIQKLDNTIEP